MKRSVKRKKQNLTRSHQIYLKKRLRKRKNQVICLLRKKNQRKLRNKNHLKNLQNKTRNKSPQKQKIRQNRNLHLKNQKIKNKMRKKRLTMLEKNKNQEKRSNLISIWNKSLQVNQILIKSKKNRLLQQKKLRRTKK